MMLLLASCIFYMAFIPAYILILFVTIVVDYFAGIMIENSADSKKKFYLIVSIVSTCLVLFIFKYFNFFNSSFASIANFFDLRYPIGIFNIILPIGLSFHTFQSLSYVIEVYRGNQKAERHFGIYSLYVMFYPQLVAGPIERPSNLLPQFFEKHSFDYQRVTSGLRLMLWGFFKKIVIADRLAVFVNEVYGNPGSYNSISLIVATLFFSFQIYCDFSGYSDIAIGAARVMGFKLMRNFRTPYYSKSISEFWKRWHISLSTWFRDYLYIPLGGNRVSKFRNYFNIFFIFLVSGLWHGANWTFIVWGALHGFYMVAEKIIRGLKSSMPKFIWKNLIPSRTIKILMTFFLVNFSWIFFRSESLSDSMIIMRKIFSLDLSGISIFSFNKNQLAIGVCAILVMEIVQLIQEKGLIDNFLYKRPIFVRWVVYYLCIMGILAFGEFRAQDFIYFQF